MSADLLGNSGGAIAEIEILRGDLVRILSSATRDDVSYIFDDSIKAIEQGEDGVTVAFEHGDQRVFDLVVGADGLHSNVRALAFGAESAFVRDLGAYVASFTVPNPVTLNDWELMYSIPGKTAGLYPIRQNTEAIALFYFASPPLLYDRHAIAQQKRFLAETFALVGWEVPQVLGAMWEAPDFYFDRLSQVRMDHWSNGRVALLGDAAYGPSPLSGMGTSLALVGAYVLAGELAAAAGDHRIAFTRYENAMRNYVEQGQKQVEGAKFGLLPRSYSQIRLRNIAWRMLPYMPWRGVVAGGARKAATAISLKDYEAVGVRSISSM